MRTDSGSSRLSRYRTPRRASGARGCVDLVAINYRPEITGIGPYVTDLAQRLAANGWSVRVVTGFPHYPQWRLPDDLPAARTSGLIDGVEVVRVRHSVPPKPGLAGRARMEAGFGLRALRAGLRRESTVVVVSPPLIAAWLILLRQRLRRPRRRQPIGIWVQDLYGRAVVQTGAPARAAGLVDRLEASALRAATGVGVVHARLGQVAGHRKDGKNRKDSPDDRRVVELRNWNQALLAPRRDRAAARDELGIAADPVIAVHAGNIGRKQGLENVVAAAHCADRAGSTTQFHVVGDGNQRAALESAGAGVAALTFVDPLPAGAFHRYLSAADVLLVNESPGVTDMCLPSKLTTYFSIGLPVVAAVADDSITADEIRRAGAGEIVVPGDPDALWRAVERLAADPVRARALGESGKRYAQTQLSAPAAVERFEQWLDDLAARQTGRVRR